MPYKNKADQAASARRHYLKNKEKMKARARAYTTANRRRQRDFLAYTKTDAGCVDCGYRVSSVALHFDHVETPKLGDIATMVGSGSGWQTLYDEMDKCEIRCANCPAEKTQERQDRSDLPHRTKEPHLHRHVWTQPQPAKREVPGKWKKTYNIR